MGGQSLASRAGAVMCAALGRCPGPRGSGGRCSQAAAARAACACRAGTGSGVQNNQGTGGGAAMRRPGRAPCTAVQRGSAARCARAWHLTGAASWGWGLLPHSAAAAELLIPHRVAARRGCAAGAHGGAAGRRLAAGSGWSRHCGARYRGAPQCLPSSAARTAGRRCVAGGDRCEGTCPVRRHAVGLHDWPQYQQM